ncbi:MAG: Gfo/Idh/MocA family oxidoreductase [Anaerolineaceae bacterium]|nr:Gfo/Idh/MocA family oxidoreductase [Anaerolineaceae bacterium]
MTLRFSVIGLAHTHVYGATRQLLNAGAELVSVASPDLDALARYTGEFPQAQVVTDADAILEDSRIQLVIGMPRPDERAALGMRVMGHGKDYLAGKPAFTTLEQVQTARKIQQETGRKFMVYFSERFANPATVKAGELVAAGAIGSVIHTLGIGPHSLNHASRPDWFFSREQGGGILNDLASHQIDQFLYFTGSTSAEIVTSQIANYQHPQFPEFDDFGDLVIRSDRAAGYVRVDWFSPGGLGAWGDVRLFLTGTEGTIELRKIVDVQGRPGGNHLFLVNGSQQEYINCSDMPLPFGAQVVADVRNRTETAIPQAHTFLASELALQAQIRAVRVAGESLQHPPLS